MVQMVCELLLERGDYVLAEEYTYPSVIESVIIPKGYKPLGVKLDQDGIRPESLLEVAHIIIFAALPTCSTISADLLNAKRDRAIRHFATYQY